MADQKTWLEVAKGLATEPTYLFGFSLFLTLGAVFVSEKESMLRLVALVGVIVVTLVGIVLVERRRKRTIPTADPDQKVRLQELPGAELAIRDVLGSLVDNERETYFVYSSTVANELFDHENRPIQLNPDEKHVTTIFDVRGISKIHSLLDVGGKTKLLNIRTAENFPPEAWDCNLVLVGSRNANPITEEALQEDRPPFMFAPDMKSIVAGATARWPADEQEAKEFDFAILAKLVKKVGDETRVRLIAAGIGAAGTLGACHYLQSNVVALQGRFGDGPFACVLRIDKSRGFTSVKEEECRGLKV